MPVFSDSEGGSNETREYGLNAQYLRDARALADIAEYIPHLIWSATGDGTGLYANRSLLEYLGKTIEWVEADVWFDVVHPDDRAAAREAWHVSKRSGSEYSAEYRLRRADGTYVWHLSRGIPVRDESGRILQWFGTLTDIQAQKERAELLFRSEQQFRAFVENSPDPVARIDRNGVRLYVNPALLNIYSAKPEDMVGKSLFAASELTPAVEDSFRQAVKEVIRSGRETLMILERPFPGGTRCFQIRLVPEFSSGGEVETVLMLGRDVTDLIEKERELNRAKLQAEAANLAKSEFLADMSHEIRTPIAGVIGLADMLLAREQSDENRSVLTLMKSSAESLLTLIAEILDLSKVESRWIERHEVVFDLRNELQRLYSVFLPLAEKKGVEFTLEVAPEVGTVFEGDSEKITRVLQNLLSNAIKYTNEGRVELRVDVPGRTTANLQEAEAEVCRFSVSDSGPGIPREKRDRLFQPFSRIQRSGYRKTVEGAGLGLVISKRLAEFLDGGISFESEEGKGSTFIFSVPLRTAAAELLPPVEPPVTGRLSSLPALRVLLAEDDAINRLFMTSQLESAGHRVSVVTNGEEALAALTRGRFDVVLMDIQMPVLDGVEATRRIREMGDARADVPIVALTAYAMREDEEYFISSGMNGCVTKPVNFSLLAEELARVCGSAGSAGGTG